MFCPKCGNRLPDNARFCDVCGAVVGQSAPRRQAAPGAAPARRQAARRQDGGDWALGDSPRTPIPLLERFGLNLMQSLACLLMALAVVISLVCVNLDLSWLRAIVVLAVAGALLVKTPCWDADMGAALSLYGLYFMIRDLAGCLNFGFFQVALRVLIYGGLAFYWLVMGGVMENRRLAKPIFCGVLALGALMAFICCCTHFRFSFRRGFEYLADVCVLGGLALYFAFTRQGDAARERYFRPRGLIMGLVGGAIKGAPAGAARPRAEAASHSAAPRAEAQPRQSAPRPARSSRDIMSLSDLLVDARPTDFGTARANQVYDPDGAVVGAFALTGVGSATEYDLIDTSNRIICAVRQDGGLQAAGQADIFDSRDALAGTCSWHGGSCTVLDAQGQPLCRMVSNRAGNGRDILSMEDLKVGEIIAEGSRLRIGLDPRITGSYKQIIATAAIVAALAK